MREERLVDAMNFIEDDILEESFEVRQGIVNVDAVFDGPVAVKASILPRWGKAIIAAAAMCLISIGIFNLIPDDEGELIYGKNFSGAGSGIVFSEENLELVNTANPWMQNDVYMPAKLPVYKNLSYSPAGEPSGINDEQMLDLLEETADSMGLEIEKVEKTVNPRDPEKVFCYSTVASNTTIEVEADGLITITIKDEPGVDMTAELDYSMLGFEEPIATKNIEGNHIIYEGKGNLSEDMLNYFFGYAEFYPSEEGRRIIRIHNELMAAEKLGDYFNITIEEATKKLYSGEYYTNSGYGIYKDSHIAKCDLVYRNSRTEEAFVPYYCFYIEIEDENLPSGYHYGTFYVPAVDMKDIVG